MDKQQQIKGLIFKQGILPLFYHSDEQVSIGIVKALYQAGIRAIEYTNRGDNALENFRVIKKYASEHLEGLQCGIGTVKTNQDAINYIQAGADFIVCPVVNPEVAALTQGAGVLWIPGCMTPTEVNLAEMNGASFVKIFPGSVVGPIMISSILELFPKMSFMPTGGVELDEDNLHSWFNAGCVAVGMGSKLITKYILENKLYEKLTADTANALNLVRSCKK
jgi:2-dehydro-3-deoxyphosphogluconate aldolase/(4S)-4-hydroxy-2-oxoglutarate aldolase